MSESEQAAEIAQLRRQFDAVSERLAEARRAVGLLNAIIDALPVGVTVQTEDGAVVLQNGMAAEISEPSADGASSRAAPFGVGEAEKTPQPAGAITTEERVVAGSDSAVQRTLLIAHRPVRILDRPLLVSTAFDFTERKQAEVELSKRAYFDELTGLPNGALLQNRFGKCWRTARGAAVLRWRFSTSIISSTSTTITRTRSATRFCSRSRSGFPRIFGRPISPAASAATSFSWSFIRSTATKSWKV